MKHRQTLSLVLLLLLTITLVSALVRAEPAMPFPSSFASSPVVFLPLVRQLPSVTILLPIIRRAVGAPSFSAFVTQWDSEGDARIEFPR